MKIAFCFSGEIRDIEKSYPFFKTLINKFSPDIFLSTWDTENPQVGDTIHNFKEKYNPLICEVENWKAWKSQYSSTIIPYYQTPKDPVLRLNPKEEKQAESIVRFAQWYKIQRANYLTKMVNNNYDIVVKLRTDLILKDDFFLFKNDSLNFSVGKMILPAWGNIEGPHDYVFYGKPQYMDYATNLFYFISHYHREGQCIHPPENLLRHHLSQQDISLRFYNFQVMLRGNNAIQTYPDQPFNFYTSHSSRNWKQPIPNSKLSFYKDEVNIT